MKWSRVALIAIGTILLIWLGMSVAFFYRISNISQVKLIFILPNGFVGKAAIVEDPKHSADPNGTYIVRIKNGQAQVPAGFLHDYTQVGFTVLEVRDEAGHVLSKGLEPKKGLIGLRGYGKEYDPDMAKQFPNGIEYFYFSR